MGGCLINLLITVCKSPDEYLGIIVDGLLQELHDFMKLFIK